jgi:hypothetical protein
MWNDIMWLHGFSLSHPLNFGIFEGSLVGIAGQVGSCWIGSLVIFFFFFL